MQANRIGLPHLEHGRIPISARLYSRFGWIDDIMLPCIGREHYRSLSPITAYSDGDGASLAQYTNVGLVNTDHYENLISARTAPVWGTLRPCMQVNHRWTQIRAVMKPACTSKVRSRWSILLTSEKLNGGESHTHLTTHSGRRAHRRTS
jgi:hypothetical protein